MDFRLGDLVRLKSGGPLMTVEQVGQTSLADVGVWCVWFEKVSGKQVVGRDTFAPVLLERSEKPASGVVFG